MAGLLERPTLSGAEVREILDRAPGDALEARLVGHPVFGHLAHKDEGVDRKRYAAT